MCAVSGGAVSCDCVMCMCACMCVCVWICARRARVQCDSVSVNPWLRRVHDIRIYHRTSDLALVLRVSAQFVFKHSSIWTHFTKNGNRAKVKTKKISKTAPTILSESEHNDKWSPYLFLSADRLGRFLDQSNKQLISTDTHSLFN